MWIEGALPLLSQPLLASSLSSLSSPLLLLELLSIISVKELDSESLSFLLSKWDSESEMDLVVLLNPRCWCFGGNPQSLFGLKLVGLPLIWNFATGDMYNPNKFPLLKLQSCPL